MPNKNGNGDLNRDPSTKLRTKKMGGVEVIMDYPNLDYGAIGSAVKKIVTKKRGNKNPKGGRKNS
tara:strand:+ start:2489 stop:2683 length:195 start_codon:yes stop_codon:yes gene_type:complete